MASENDVIWREEQTRQLEALITAAQDPTDPSLRHLVEQVVAHYEKYHTFKTRWGKDGYALVFLSPPWNTPLEDTLVWIGGWRPTIAFHIIYSVSDRQTSDLGDLSAVQLGSLYQLHRTTIQDENAITDQLAKHQAGVAGTKAVRLSNELSEPVRENRIDDEDRVQVILEPKEDGFGKILQRADQLRLSTIKSIVRILSPIQAVHFLIAATELQLRLHDWGKVEHERHINNIQGAAVVEPITT
ncbi:tgacg-sequence-specific DNA-binding protein tga-2.1 [Phtheirospermum japonicum]|uniref:Tgacg-sequence-specific DNA-binding protein tga-2.1 n=1 Tax=Phtheirospermum japonicum TaxID=374723 RepID=A0A830BDT8_9LAMI|nr:tgacg-sequence-specific DNA-binding protein tga-2.1 [Phtheirospermum japonicum]